MPAASAEQFRWIVEPRYDRAESFSEGMAAVMTGGRCGYINSSGEVVIKPAYDEAGDFYDGLASVINDGLLMFINYKGVQVIAVKEDERRYFGDGLAVVRINGKYGYLTSGGKPVLKPVYEYALSFNEGVAAVKIDSKYGYINRSGITTIKPQYEMASIFSEGVAAVKINGKWGYINKRGSPVISKVFTEAGDFSSGLAPAKNDAGFGYINRMGVFVIKPQFEAALSFTESIAAVKFNGKWGYIKRTDSRKMREKKISSQIEIVQDSKKVPESVISKNGLERVETKDSGLNKKITGENLRGKDVTHIERNGESGNSVKSTDNANYVNIDKNIPVIKGMEYVGILSEVNEGQVVITDNRTGEKVYLGAWCITKVDEDKVYLEAGTPFSTVAKCESRNGFYEKIKPGMKVYKKNK